MLAWKTDVKLYAMSQRIPLSTLFAADAPEFNTKIRFHNNHQNSVKLTHFGVHFFLEKQTIIHIHMVYRGREILL